MKKCTRIYETHNRAKRTIFLVCNKVTRLTRKQSTRAKRIWNNKNPKQTTW